MFIFFSGKEEERQRYEERQGKGTCFKLDGSCLEALAANWLELVCWSRTRTRSTCQRYVPKTGKTWIPKTFCSTFISDGIET